MNFEKAITDRTRVSYAETFGNPKSDVIDIEVIAQIAHKHCFVFVIDNTLTTPYLFRPLEYDADVVVESVIKFIPVTGAFSGNDSRVREDKLVRRVQDLSSVHLRMWAA